MLSKSIIFLLTVITLGSVSAQNPVKRDLDPFSKIYVEDRIIVRLVKSDKESAQIQVQGIEESAVKTEVADNTLRINIEGEPFTKKKVMVTLNFVNLSGIEVAGGADITTTSLLKAPELNIDLKSGGMLYLDADIGSLTGKLTEGALCTAEGYVEKMKMTVATRATLSAYELECEDAEIKASTGGKAKIHAANTLNAEASTRGFISYKGDPQILNRNVSSGGIIEIFKP